MSEYFQPRVVTYTLSDSIFCCKDLAKGESNEEFIREVRRDVHFDFMVAAAKSESRTECDNIASTQRLLIADLIKEATLDYELQAEKEVGGESSAQSIENILACTRHATFQSSHNRGSDFLVWDVIEQKYVVVAKSNGHWHNGKEVMQSPLVSESIYKKILLAHSEDLLNNNDACAGLHASPTENQRCCEGLVNINGACTDSTFFRSSA